jgi:hypothetical protein
MARQRNNYYGECRVCGETGKLTYEHVPPAGAYNDLPAEMYTLGQWMSKAETGKGRYRLEQRGTGYYALCETCNNTRGGSWYVPEFEKWISVGAEGLRRLPDPRPEGVIAQMKLEKLRPALFTKQVVMMLLALNAPEFGADHPDLRGFVLDREARGLPTRYRLFLSLFDGDVGRWGGFYTAIPFDRDLRPLPPIGVTDLLYYTYAYTLTIDETAPKPRPGEITSFTDYGADDTPELSLVLPYGSVVMPVEQPIPD